MKKKVKKYLFPGLTLSASLYVSSLLAIGVIIGYAATEIFYRRYVKTGRVNLLILKFGKWRMHVHHWISGTLAIAALAIISSLSFFSLGLLGGIIFHDLYRDKTWHRVIYKKEE